MKKVITVKRVIIAASAIITLIVGSVFLILYSNRFIDKQTESIGTSKQNSIVLTPKNFGSYGELMFAYIGENNYIYNLDDESQPLILQPAALLLYASDDTVIYTASVELDSSHYGRESLIQELQIGENENTLYTIASVTLDPCWSSNDEVVYFVKDDHPNQLYTFEPLTSTTEMAAEFEESITGLRISSDGLLVTVESGAEMLYVPLSKQLTEAYYNCQGSRLIVCEQYDLILSPDGILSYRWMGSNDAVKIAERVLVTSGYQDNEVLYIQKNDDGVSLNAYYVSEEKTRELAKLPDNILPQLTVSADYAFMVDDRFIVYRLNLDDDEFTPFCKINNDVLNPLIAVFDYRLMIYDLAKETDSSYCYAIDATATIDEATVAQLQAILENDQSVEAVDYPTLANASIGSEVVELQEKLIDLGYLHSEPSGIFDVETTVAVQYLQSDVGVIPSGMADSKTMVMIFNEQISHYDGYAALSVTSSGPRVRDLQARLRFLEFLKSNVTDNLNDETINALTLFAKQNGFDYSGGVIQPQILENLFNTSTVKNKDHIILEKGDNCPATTSLNKRLKELGYLVGSVNPCFEEKTQTAILLFQEVNGLQTTGKCDDKTIELLFSENATICPEDKAPITVDETSSTNINQVISDRQLKIIRKWLTKQFAVNHTDKQAVKRLQMQLVKLGYLDVQDVSMIYDQNTMEAVRKFQTENELQSDGIASKTTLTEIFNKTIKNASADS